MTFFAQNPNRLRGRIAALREAVERHPGRVAAAVGSTLLLSSATAFGLAEYGLQPQLPSATTLSIPVAIDVAPQVQALDDQPQQVYTTAHVRASDTVESLLRRLQVTDPAQLKDLVANADLRVLLDASGGVVTAKVNSVGQLVQLQARLPQTAPTRPEKDLQRGGVDHAQVPGRQTWRLLTLTSQSGGGFASTVTQESAQAQLRMATGVVQSTLFAAADEAHMPDAVATQLVNLFAGEVDFRRSLRPGDRFTVVWRQYEAGGQTLRVGRIVSAQITSRGVTHAAVWFDPQGDKKAAGYYKPDGSSLTRAFLLSPLPYDRLTSGYGWRISPIFHKPEFHKGIDLAIPVGTPVRTIADGRVVYAGWGTGYGKYVKVVHPDGFATIYSHLSQFDVHVGEHVKQGEVVARSGNTGWSTGPHLYFQFFVDGRPVNPLTISHYSPKGSAVPADLRSAFFAQTSDPAKMLALVPGPEVASGVNQAHAQGALRNG
ncbi:M23 family metallopeptidase [Thiomonas sp. FB-Cd]|uniref:M23 family metallopeptidase n=1 Tax=Thiomonas sp. FB-Cd TaxID=1158292 RepID=UPI0004DF7023|nr:M23 family metallopeptidase [Thiomonas sp. FB-Cd]